MKKTTIPTRTSPLLTALAVSGLLLFSACGDTQNTDTSASGSGYAKDQDRPLRENPASDNPAGGVPTENVADRSTMAEMEADSAMANTGAESTATFERTSNTDMQGAEADTTNAQLNQNHESSATFSTDPTRTMNSSGHPMEIEGASGKGQQQTTTSGQTRQSGSSQADTIATGGQENQTPPGTSPQRDDQ